MDKYLPAVAQMNDIIHAIYVLIAVVITGIGTVAAAYLYQVKVSIPRRFEQQTAERQIQLDAMQKDFENKAAGQAVDVERDRMLPLMVENNQRLVDSMIKSKDADTAAILQRIELDKTAAAVLAANTQQITTHNDRLEENTEKLEGVEKKLGVVEDKVEKLYNRFLVVFPRESNVHQLFDELKDLLEETKKVCGEKKKEKTGEIAVLPALPEKENILLTGVLPDDLGIETDGGLKKAG